MGNEPSEWIPRTDAGARKVIGRLDDLKEQHRVYQEGLARTQTEVEQLSVEVEKLLRILPTLVTYSWLVPIVGAAAVVIITSVWAMQGPARDDLREMRKTSSEDARQLRQETSATVQRIEAKTDALIKVQLDQRPRSEVRAETQRALSAIPQADGGKHGQAP